VRAVLDLLAASPGPVPPGAAGQGGPDGEDGGPARRVLVHPSGFRQSPYADIKPAGVDPSTGRPAAPPSKLWHSSPGSSGW
jgi:error-prone DNA polymerase